MLLDNYGGERDPGPKRGEGTWDELLKIHMDTFWQCDFLSVKSLTIAGFVDQYLLAFIHLGTRCAWISPFTQHPDSAWVTQQGRNFLMHAEDVCFKPTYVGRDNDSKFTASFDEVFESADVNVKKTTPVSPNLQAHIERFVQTARQECLDHFLICGEKHLNYVCNEFHAHDNGERAHSPRDQLPPAWSEKPAEIETIRIAEVRCETRLGRLLRAAGSLACREPHADDGNSNDGKQRD